MFRVDRTEIHCPKWGIAVNLVAHIRRKQNGARRGDDITLNDLPEVLRRERPAAEEFHFDLPPQGISLEGIEKELIVRALEKFNWNQTHAALYLDISRKTLIYRMEKFGLRKEHVEAEDQTATCKALRRGLRIFLSGDLLRNHARMLTWNAVG